MIPVFILEEPHYHRLQLDAVNRFRGVALAIDTPEIHRVEVFRDGVKVTEADVNLPCPELDGFLRLARAGTSRFAFDMHVERGATYELRANGETLFIYETPADVTRLVQLTGKVASLPVPPPDVVATTQGGGNVESYRDSIIAGVTTSESLLRASGIEMKDVRDVLDIGCGTGRLLVSWYCDDPTRRLAGVDINPELIAWSRQSLPDVADWRTSALWPPLDFPDASFDLILMISVLTHLPLDCQRAWITELRRLLRPGGAAMITLHGDLYAPLLLDASNQQQYRETGYVQVAGAAEGANAYATFHTPQFARELFGAFDHITHFERGMENGVLRSFPVASLQDVYVMR